MSERGSWIVLNRIESLESHRIVIGIAGLGSWIVLNRLESSGIAALLLWNDWNHRGSSGFTFILLLLSSEQREPLFPCVLSLLVGLAYCIWVYNSEILLGSLRFVHNTVLCPNTFLTIKLSLSTFSRLWTRDKHLSGTTGTNRTSVSSLLVLVWNRFYLFPSYTLVVVFDFGCFICFLPQFQSTQITSLLQSLHNAVSAYIYLDISDKLS